MADVKVGLLLNAVLTDAAAAGLSGDRRTFAVDAADPDWTDGGVLDAVAGVGSARGGVTVAEGAEGAAACRVSDLVTKKTESGLRSSPGFHCPATRTKDHSYGSRERM
jgi:hypothetical protein